MLPGVAVGAPPLHPVQNGLMTRLMTELHTLWSTQNARILFRAASKSFSEPGGKRSSFGLAQRTFLILIVRSGMTRRRAGCQSTFTV